MTTQEETLFENNKNPENISGINIDDEMKSSYLLGNTSQVLNNSP